MLDFSRLPPPLADLLSRILKAIKARAKLDFLTVALPVLTIVIGFIGYMKLDYDGTFHSLTAVLYGTLGSFKTSFKAELPHNDFTDLAADLGVITVYSWFFALAVTVLRESIEKGLARLFAWNKVIIVGDTDFATRADKIWRASGRHPLRIVSPETAATPDWASRRVRAAFDDALVRAFAVHRAEHVLIDLGDDMKTLTLSFQLLSNVAAQTEGRSQNREWVIVVRNPALADHFATKVLALFCAGATAMPLPCLHYLHPERIAARYFMAGHPLFLLAKERNQRRVHTLIVGNTPIGRELIEMSFLTPLTTDLETPVVTVLTPHPEAEHSAFFSGRPALADVVDVVFIDVAALDGFEQNDGGAAKRLGERETQMPFTVAFLISGETQENVRVALLLSRIQRKMSRLCCPIFSYEENAAEAEFLAASEAFDKAIGGFEIFGIEDEYLTQQICDADKRDLLPRALHERYRRTEGAKLTPPWNELTESLRRANRNAADHWLAKMHALGFVVDGIEAGTLPKLDQADADALLKEPFEAGADGSLSPMAAAVRCEHKRWMIERYLDGWTFGPKRDNIRQIHDRLVPWEILEREFHEEVSKVADQIAAVIESLAAHGDPQVAIKRRNIGDEMPEVAA